MATPYWWEYEQNLYGYWRFRTLFKVRYNFDYFVKLYAYQLMLQSHQHIDKALYKINILDNFNFS